MFVVHKNRNINPQMDFLNYQDFVHMFKKAVRQAEIPVTPALPKVGHPLAGGGMSPAFSACLAALFEHMHKILIIQKIHLRIYISIFVNNKH